MQAEEDFAACAQMLRAQDSHRFRAAMNAPPGRRAGLMALYAFHIEVARAPWAAREPGLGEIRLQYWSDQIGRAFRAQAVDAHPVLGAMAALVGEGRVDEADLQAMIAARRHDLDVAPFADNDALAAYLEDTSGALMRLAVAHLGAQATDLPEAGRLGGAAGLAAWFIAVPRLLALGRVPLPDSRPEAIGALARAALARLDWKAPRLARPALLSISEARPVLARVAHAPGLVAAGGLERSEFRKRARQLGIALGGRP